MSDYIVKQGDGYGVCSMHELITDKKPKCIYRYGLAS